MLLKAQSHTEYDQPATYNTMKLSEIKQHLGTAQAVNFMLPGGGYVPPHFHVTEVGMIIKQFIDCGGTVRSGKVANFQLWNANDLDHRLKPQKLLNIIALSENVLGIEDLEIEVEYQADTIGRYGLSFNGTDFMLIPMQTACLAEEACGVPQEKQHITSPGTDATACCAPGSGRC